MIHERALAIAGPTAVLASRPTGVLHVYAGPLTPSGRFVPRSRRTVCRTHTRRLTVQQIPPSSLDRAPEVRRNTRRVCDRCARHLSRASLSAQVPARPRTREQWRQLYAGVTVEQLLVDLEVAESAEEVAAVGHVALLVLGYAAARPVLEKRIRHGHGRFAHNPLAAAIEENREIADAARREQLREAHENRERRIELLGMNVAHPHPTRKATR